jgi:S-DNA-T family DNA segregation ATPase FtsK/SpoIIIE
VIPVLGSLGSVAVMATMGSATSAGRERSLWAAGIFLLATVGFVLAQLDRHRVVRLRRTHRARTAYLRRLVAVRAEVREAAAAQRAALLRRHPAPGALPALVAEGSRVWERAGEHPDFLHVRYGVGPRPLSVTLVASESAESAESADPVAASALHRLLGVHRTQPDLPVVADLRAVRRIEVRGSPDEARSLARAVVCGATAFHAPEHLAVAVLAGADALAAWDWVKWLPHAGSTRQADAVGPRRMVATDAAVLDSLLSRGPHVLLVVDALAPAAQVVLAAGREVTVLDLGRGQPSTEEAGLRLDLDGDGSLDRCDLATAEAVARRLAPRPRPGTDEERAAGDLMSLLGLPDVRRLEPCSAWRPRLRRDRLRVPIGRDAQGEPVHLDLKEAAEHGMGPHGLVVGATGSGKSELLRTLVLGLALTHSPEQLNLVLVDFKGGATFAGLSALPHVSALITNLADDLALVDRMHDALAGELLRRQEVLRSTGGHASVRDHERARAAGADLPPVPSLLVVVDEFSELLSSRPDLVELFVTIGRLGRSLGLHLLLASQRLEEGRLRGLESHLSYRVALRTFSAQESRAVLGVPDAHDLPAPGTAYLQHEGTSLLRFETAYVSGPAAHEVRRAGVDDEGILPWTLTEVRLPPSEPAAHDSPPEPLVTAAVRRMQGRLPRAHQVWLPPLDVPETLDRLMPDLAADPDLGLASRHWRSRGRLVVPIGTVDRPREQCRDPLTVDLSSAGGHVAVVGGPRSGTSTVLRTLIASLALTTTPLESQFFVLDLGSGAFAPLSRLPHLAGLATRAERDVVRRVVAQVRDVVDRRESYFRAHGIDSVDTYHRRRARGLDDDGYGEVFLVVDGWSTLRSEYDDLEPQVHDLAARGLALGCHVLAATSRWADFRPTVRDLFGTRLELRLGDPTDSEIDRRLAALVPSDRPGRGLAPTRLHVLTALPRIDGVVEAGSVPEGLADLAARAATAWRGPPGPKLQLLPERLSVAELLERADPGLVSGRRLLLGVDERRLEPVALDVDADPHWLVLGDSRSGRSATLRAYLREVVRTRTPAQARVVVVDPRRSLLDEVRGDHLLDHLTSTARATPALAELASYLEDRLPGPEVTPAQLRHRSWWTGPDVFVVVDDYDLVSGRNVNPVQPLEPLLAQAHDVGLHLVLARRVGGASRALYEPVLQLLRDLGTPTLILAGSPEEGALVGNVRAAPGPPGRGRLVTRDRGVEVVHIAWHEPAD